MVSLPPLGFLKKSAFVISWGTRHDSSGAIAVRAVGKNAESVRGSFDNTKIHELMRRTLFGETSGAEN